MASLTALVFRLGLVLRTLLATLRQSIALRDASHTSITNVPWVTVVGRVVEVVIPKPTREPLRREPLQLFIPE